MMSGEWATSVQPASTKTAAAAHVHRMEHAWAPRRYKPMLIVGPRTTHRGFDGAPTPNGYHERAPVVASGGRTMKKLLPLLVLVGVIMFSAWAFPGAATYNAPIADVMLTPSGLGSWL